MTTPTFTPMTGQDVEDIIAQNGGLGDWEDSNSAPVQRWHFPRFPGAEKLGTCKKHAGPHEKKTGCQKFAVDLGNLYLSRTGLGPYDTDVETICAWMEAPRNRVGAVWVDGNPGGGKTALIEAAATHANATLTTLLSTPDHTKDSLLLRFVGEGHGENGTPFVKGPLAHAAQYGHWFYADEFPLLIDGIKPIFYSLADGRHFLPEGNVDGSPLEIHPDFRLIMSGNMMVRGASLPEPLGSRVAGTSITVETTGAMLRDLDVSEDVVACWEGLGVAGLWRPEIREVRAADYWLGIDPTQATSAFLPPHCPESQREAIRNHVVSYLGGDLRPDGRLVVS